MKGHHSVRLTSAQILMLIQAGSYYETELEDGEGRGRDRLVLDNALRRLAEANQRAHQREAAAAHEADPDVDEQLPTARCAYCGGDVVLRSHPTKGGGAIMAADTHIDATHGYRICRGAR